MKKIGLIFLFIFMAGLFSGLFFSTNLSESNNSNLFSLLSSGLVCQNSSFVSAFFSILLASLLPMLLMLSAMLAKPFCILPPAILWYKSFATGFCTGLVYINSGEQAFFITLVKILPQSLCLIPAYLILSVGTFCFSLTKGQKNRTSREYQVLYYLLIASAGLLLLGSLIETLCGRISIS